MRFHEKNRTFTALDIISHVRLYLIAVLISVAAFPVSENIFLTFAIWIGVIFFFYYDKYYILIAQDIKWFFCLSVVLFIYACPTSAAIYALTEREDIDIAFWFVASSGVFLNTVFYLFSINVKRLEKYGWIERTSINQKENV